jgi:hypothetical protein
MRNQRDQSKEHRSKNLSLHDARNVPRTELVSARSSRPLSNTNEHHHISPCVILLQSCGNQQHKRTTIKKDHGQIPSQRRSQGGQCEIKDIHRKRVDQRAQVCTINARFPELSLFQPNQTPPWLMSTKSCVFRDLVWLEFPTDFRMSHMRHTRGQA